MKKVVIIGGGVAGMSAAHELAERGFKVEVFELNPGVAGGKARSVKVEGTSINGSEMLPGEHGFRFFPRFYRHLPDTMSRIPYKDNPNGVADNLVETSRVMIASETHAPIIAIDRFPRNLDDLKTIFSDLHSGLGLTSEELHFFASRIWQLITSCKQRIERDYERLSWWQFVEAERFSDTYQKYLATGLTRSLVALQAKEASTKTGGDILVQLLFDVARPGMSSDRVLNGPTNDVWIDPWLDYLRKIGVTYHFNSEAKAIVCENGKIQKISIQKDNELIDVTADYYLCATPVERIGWMIRENKELNEIDPSLASIQTLRFDVAWMTGIQYYLNEDVELAHGHNIFIDSPWAVTAISQKQFWNGVEFSKMYDGSIKTILSVDISNWMENADVYDAKTQKTVSRCAMNCTNDQIADTVWKQMKMALNQNGKEVLKDEYKVLYHVDKDISNNDFAGEPIPGSNGMLSMTINAEPLLINKVNTWYLRPEAYTRIPNLFLASDYVKTNTDLATMEGANEAARRAVNCIIDASGSDSSYCEIWDLYEPLIFAPWREHDRIRFEKGLPWNGDILHNTFLERVFSWVKSMIAMVIKSISRIFRR